MKTKYTINTTITTTDTIGALLDLATPIIDAHRASATRAAEIATTDRDAYLNIVTIVGKAFKSKGNTSGDVETYDRLRAGLFSSVSTLFSGSHFLDYHEQARRDLFAFLVRVYRRKLVKALEKGRDFLYLVSTKRIERIYAGLVHKHQNATISDDAVTMSFEIVHDVLAFLLDNGVNLATLSGDFDALRDMLSTTYYADAERRIRYTDTITIEDDGIYKTDEDGARRCRCRFRTRTYTHRVSDGDRVELPAPRSFADTYTIEGKWIIVKQSKSLYDVLYTMIDTYITQKRRDYVSGDDYEVLGGDRLNTLKLSYIDANIADVDYRDTYRAIYAALVVDDVKRATAKKYIAFTILLEQGYTREDAEKRVGLSRRHYQNITRDHADVIRAAITA